MQRQKRTIAFMLAVIMLLGVIGVETVFAQARIEEITDHSPKFLDAGGGTVVFTIEGVALKTTEVSAIVKLNGQRIPAIEATAKDVTSANAPSKRKDVEITFPANDSTDVKKYKVNFTLKGEEALGSILADKNVSILGKENGADTPTPPPVPTTPTLIKTEYVGADADNHQFRLTGAGLVEEKIKVRVLKEKVSQSDITNTLKKEVSSDGKTALLTLTFPANETENPIEYTVKFLVDGGMYYEDSYNQKVVITKKEEITPIVPSVEEELIADVSPEDITLQSKGGKVELSLMSAKKLKAEDIRIRVKDAGNVPISAKLLK